VKVFVDGREYRVPETFTYREIKLMKTLTGLRPGELLEAIALQDPDAAIAMAAICLLRSGELRNPNALYEKDAGSIVLDLEDDDQDDDEDEGAEPVGPPDEGGDGTPVTRAPRARASSPRKNGGRST
jgi:hypothetical protein